MTPKCKSCSPSPREPLIPTEMQFSAQRAHITLADGSRSALNRAFINPMYRPPNGWSFQFILNGSQHSVSKKKRAVDVFSEVLRIHQDNGKVVSHADVWLNLNIYWLTKIDRKYWLVGPDELTQAAKPVNDPEEVAMLKVTPPQVWGSRAWNWMGLYLAGNDYEPATFLTIVQQVLLLLDPGRNPSVGCQLCYLEFNTQVGHLRTDPPTTRLAAREWLWAFHNAVNKRVGKTEITYAQAAKANFWTP